jgi:hypothetical protein
VDLDVARSHSRPHVSNDNPYSEAAFKTLKYCPEYCPAFPDHFDDIEHARAFGKEFFDYHNHEHYHSGLGLHTPHPSTMEPPRRSAPTARASSPPPTPATPSGSAATPNHPTTDRRMDQPTQRTGPATEQLTTRCPRNLDRFRFPVVIAVSDE